MTLAPIGMVDLIARSSDAPSGTRRFADNLGAELRGLGVDAHTTPTYVPRYRRAAGRIRGRTGIDLAAFLGTYPLTLDLRRGALAHLTTQTFATALWRPLAAVVTVHDLFPTLGRPGPSRLAARAFDAFAHVALRRALWVIVDCQAVADGLAARGLVNTARLSVVALGVDHAIFRPRLVDDDHWNWLGLEPNTPFLLYVGTEAPRKRVELLLHLLALLRRRGLRKLVLVKAGPPAADARDRLKTLAAALDIANAVRWLDRVDDARLAWLYRHAALYVSASAQEGFGLPVLEAMASGCPVAVSPIRAHAELVATGGVLLPRNGLEEWVACLHELLRDDSRLKSLGEQSLSRASQYTWRRTARESIQAYAAARHMPTAT